MAKTDIPGRSRGAHKHREAIMRKAMTKEEMALLTWISQTPSFYGAV